MNDCRHIQDKLLTEYIDDSLTAADRARIDRHLASCAACLAVLESVRRTENLLRTAPALTPPDHLWPDIRARIDASGEHAAFNPWNVWREYLFGAPRRVLWTTLAVIVILAGVTTPAIIGSRRAGPPPETGSSLIALVEDHDQIILPDEINLDTNAEYFYHYYKGETI